MIVARIYIYNKVKLNAGTLCVSSATIPVEVHHGFPGLFCVDGHHLFALCFHNQT